jgi:hypothetical protein
MPPASCNHAISIAWIIPSLAVPWGLALGVLLHCGYDILMPCELRRIDEDPRLSVTLAVLCGPILIFAAICYKIMPNPSQNFTTETLAFAFRFGCFAATLMLLLRFIFYLWGQPRLEYLSFFRRVTSATEFVEAYVAPGAAVILSVIGAQNICFIGS